MVRLEFSNHLSSCILESKLEDFKVFQETFLVVQLRDDGGLISGRGIHWN